jgi:hypothetical protein
MVGSILRLMHLMKDPDKVIDQLHEIMAVFLVPKKKTWYGWKKQPYNSDKHKEVADAMLQSTYDNCTTFVRFFLSSYLMSAKLILESSVRQAEKIKRQAEKELRRLKQNTGWLNVVNNLSNNDATKWGYFFALPLTRVLEPYQHFRKQNSLTSTTNRSKMAFDKLIDALNEFRGAIRQRTEPFFVRRLKC